LPGPARSGPVLDLDPQEFLRKHAYSRNRPPARNLEN
jgi:hypothetical protein